MTNSLLPHGLYSPWNSPSQNTGVGSCSLLQGIFPTQGLNLGLPHCKQMLYQLRHAKSASTHLEKKNLYNRFTCLVCHKSVKVQKCNRIILSSWVTKASGWCEILKTKWCLSLSPASRSFLLRTTSFSPIQSPPSPGTEQAASTWRGKPGPGFTQWQEIASFSLSEHNFRAIRSLIKVSAIFAAVFCEPPGCNHRFQERSQDCCHCLHLVTHRVWGSSRHHIWVPAGGRLDSFHRHNAVQLQTTPQTRRPDRCQDRDTQGCVQSTDYPPLKDVKSEAQGSEVTCLRSNSW